MGFIQNRAEHESFSYRTQPGSQLERLNHRILTRVYLGLSDTSAASNWQVAEPPVGWVVDLRHAVPAAL